MKRSRWLVLIDSGAYPPRIDGYRVEAETEDEALGRVEDQYAHTKRANLGARLIVREDLVVTVA